MRRNRLETPECAVSAKAKCGSVTLISVTCACVMSSVFVPGSPHSLKAPLSHVGGQGTLQGGTPRVLGATRLGSSPALPLPQLRDCGRGIARLPRKRTRSEPGTAWHVLRNVGCEELLHIELVGTQSGSGKTQSVLEEERRTPTRARSCSPAPHTVPHPTPPPPHPPSPAP